MASGISFRVGRFAYAGLLAIPLSLPLAGPAAAATEVYMVAGLPFFAPYHAAIATVDVTGDKVSGTLAPPAGDPRAALPMSGTVTNGLLRLTVGSGADAYSFTFTENERGLHRIWEEAVAIPGLDPVAAFRPAAGFSEPAAVLQRDADDWCGLIYGGLDVVLRAADLKDAAAAPAALAELDVLVVPQQGGSATVKMKDAWSRLRLAARAGEDVSVDIAVPVGTEARVAQELRRVPLVSAVLLPSVCGESALAVVPRAKLMDGGKVSDARLKAYGEAMLARLLSGAAPEAGTPGARKFKITGAAVVPGEGGAPVFRAVVTGEAEATRLGKGSWDQFTLTLLPVVTAADTADTISLIPWVSDLKAAKKAGPQPPAESAFKPADDSAQVAAIVQRMVSWIAAAEATRCNFVTEAGFDEPEGSLPCTNAALDDVSHPEEN
ncbi:hypothetical protein ACI7BZ_19780 [Xanthobacter sp. AM11]|uniref:hypothetical protein n=1 Tax=Xanthobacter sp. AM11 TaxID=3380643 RepID=UPI0039BEE57C